MNLARFFLSPTGRIGWRGFLVGIVAIAGLEWAIASAGSAWLMLGAAIALSYPVFCLFAKRLHDMGASAWPAAALALVEIGVAWLAFSYVTNPEAGAAIAAPWEPDKLLAMRAFGLVGMALSFILFGGVVLGLIGPGARGDNRYGPEPAQ